MHFLPVQLQEVQEKSSKLQSQLSVSHHRLSSVQRKNEQLTVAQQQQQITLGAQLDALKLQFNRSQPQRQKTEQILVRDFFLSAVINTKLALL